MKIGVDLGGTNVRAALVDGTTVIRKEKKRPHARRKARRRRS